MFSSSVTVAGGSVCLGCQLRAVTRRAVPALAGAGAAHVQAQPQAQLGTVDTRRQYASEATKSDPGNDLAAILHAQKHQEDARRRKRPAFRSGRAPVDDWDRPAQPSKSKSKKENKNKIETGGTLHESAASPRWQEPFAYDPSDSLNKRQHREQSESPPQASPDDWLFQLEQKDENYENDTKPIRSRRDDTLSSPGTGRRLSLEEHDEAQGSCAPDDGAQYHDAQVQDSESSFRRVGERQGENSSERDIPRYEDERFAAEAAKYRSSRRSGEPNTYRKGDTRLVEKVNKLSGQTLGKPAEVIVLRDDGQWRRKPLKEDKGPVDTSFNLETQADQEEGLDLDLVLDNIEGLRPVHRILPSSEFKAVFDSLLSGFNSIQLESYVERHQTREEEGGEAPSTGVASDVSAASTRPWILGQSAWTPDVKGAVQDLPAPLKGYILKSMPPKQRLVMMLMRECWDMSVQEVMDGQGTLEVRLRDTEFKLLTLGAQRWLQTILRIHLSPGGGKSIQVVKSRNAIRIIAPKVVAEACLKAINDTLQKMKTKTFRRDSIPMERLSADMLEEVGSLTNSVVRFNGARKQIEITWIEVRNVPGSKLEDLADVVFRLLLMAQTPGRMDSRLVVYPDSKGEGRLVEDNGSKSQLSWVDRRKTWARLCLPLRTETPRVSSVWPLNFQDTLKYDVRPEPEDLILPTSTIEPKKEAFYASLAGVPLTFPKPPKAPQPKTKEPEPTKPTPSGWLPFRVRTNAVFGHIFNVNNPEVANSIHDGTEVHAASSRALNPLIPPVSQMTLPGWTPYKIPKYMTSLILMRFAPYSPDPATQSVDPLTPHLELRIKATDDAIIELDSLRAVAHTHVSDILLPTERVDVRATQRVVAELPGPRIQDAEGMQPLQQFLHDAKLEMAQGKLVTPPRIADLGLPAWMFYRPETDAESSFLHRAARQRLLDEAAPARTGKKQSGGGSGSSEARGTDAYAPASNAVRTASYIFAGLELHRPLETTYDGWRLLYTSVEAGQGGGRRAELSLEAVPGGDRALRRDAAGVDGSKFLRSVYRLVRGVEGTGPKADDEDWGKEVKTRIGWLGKAKKV